MKKLFLLCILLFTVNTFAQEQTLKVYTLFTVVAQDKEPETITSEARFFVNYGNVIGDIKLYLVNTTFMFRQNGETTTGNTTSGISYTLHPLIDLNTGDELYLQYFESVDVIRLIFDTTPIMFEFSN